MDNDRNNLKCYYDPDEGFPFISANKDLADRGFLYLVCENLKMKHINKFAVQPNDETARQEIAFSTEVLDLKNLDNKYKDLLFDYPDSIGTIYESIKNLYVMEYKIEMASGIRFIFETFSYEIIAKGSELSENNMRSFGIRNLKKVLTSMAYENEKYQKEINAVRIWKKSLEAEKKFPSEESLKKFCKAYDTTSEELHSGDKSSATLFEAFQDTMDFLYDFHGLKNEWSEQDE